MTDKDFKTQQARVRKLFWKWRKPLGLAMWVVTLDYSRERNEASTLTYAPPDVSGFFSCVFDVHADFYYKTAGITAYLPIVMNVKDDETLERYFVHELMHIILRPMKHKQRSKEEELVATNLADAFLWTVEAVKKKEL